MAIVSTAPASTGQVDYWFYITDSNVPYKLPSFLPSGGFYEVEAISATYGGTPIVTIAVVDSSGSSLYTYTTYDTSTAETTNSSRTYFNLVTTGAAAITATSTVSATNLKFRKLSEGSTTATGVVLEYGTSGSITLSSAKAVAIIGGGGAGGGGNGFNNPGGGGGSGFLTTGTLNAGNYSYTIGAGGTGVAGGTGGNGTATTISNLTANPGNGGRNANGGLAGNGGSGGGTQYTNGGFNGNGGAGTGSGVTLPWYITPGSGGNSGQGNNSAGSGGGTYAGGGAGGGGNGNTATQSTGGGGTGPGGGGGGGFTLVGSPSLGGSGAAGKLYVLDL